MTAASHEVAIAVARGEMDAMYVSDTSANDYVQAKQAVPVTCMSAERSRFFPEVKTIYQAVNLTPEQKWWFDFDSTLYNMARILVTTPGVSEERLAFLRAAVKNVLTDPKVIAQGEKIKHYINFIDPEMTHAEAVSVVTNMSPERREEGKEVIEKKFH